MCDICNLKCANCNRTVHTHIGDFSVSRECVIVYCHKCQSAALSFIVRFDKQLIVFADSGCLFMVNLPRSIALNGTRKECLGSVPAKGNQ
jgi:hypothetical protein